MIEIGQKPKVEQRVSKRSLRWLIRGLIIFLWTASLLMMLLFFYVGVPSRAKLPSLGDLATLLFGASSIALIIFSLLIGAVAVGGYQTLREGVKKDIEAATQDRFKDLEKELRGRVIAAIGLMTGTLYSKPEQLEQDEEDKDYLSEAVLYCREAYRLLKDVQGNAKFMALNNYVYYSCLLGGQGTDDPLLRDDLLNSARELREIGKDKNYTEALLTYCRVTLQLSIDQQELKDAHSIATSLLRKELTPRQRKEATFYVASLSGKLPGRSTGTKRP